VGLVHPAGLTSCADNGIEASFCWHCLGAEPTTYRQQVVES
jgi:hypothetical protein